MEREGREGGMHWGALNSADRVGPWDHGAMEPRALGDHGAMRRAVRAGRAEQAEGAGMHSGPLNAAGRVQGPGAMGPCSHGAMSP